jgi:hypothetical protein
MPFVAAVGGLEVVQRFKGSPSSDRNGMPARVTKTSRVEYEGAFEELVMNWGEYLYGLAAGIGLSTYFRRMSCATVVHNL